MTSIPTRALLRARASLSLSFLLPLGACSGETIVGPSPGAHIKRYAKTAGRHVVAFEFENRTSNPVDKPHIQTSCGCHDVEFSPDPIPPGATATLRIAQESAVFPVRGNAHLTWADGRTDDVDWIILADTTESLMVSPMEISADVVDRDRSVTLAFVADLAAATPGDFAPRLRAALDGVDVPLRVQHVEPDGDGRYRGYVQVDLAAAPEIDGDRSLLQITDDQLGTVAVRIY